MAAPIAGVAVRYIVIRGGVAVTRTIMKQYGKRTARKRMQKAAAKRGGKALAPAPQGPYGSVPRHKSRGGQHTASSRMARNKARKSMRGPSAQKRIQRKLAMRNKRHAASRAYRYDPFVDIYDEIYEDMYS